MGRGVRIVLGHNFYSSQENTNNAVNLRKKVFRLRKIGLFKKVFYILFLGFHAFWGNDSSNEINFCSTKMTFVHCQLKSCLLNAIKGYSQVEDEVVGIVGGKADVFHALGTLVRFNDFVEIFSHKTRECGERPAKALCQTSVCNCAASGIEGQHFN